MSSLFRGDGLLLQDIDLACSVPAERYECQTCFWRGQLTYHGKCGYCNSDTVMPTAIIDGPERNV